MTTTTVSGMVRLEGDVPAPKKWLLSPALKRHLGRVEYQEQIWLIGADQGIAESVVLLRNKAVAKPILKPSEKVYFDKVGPEYEPRVLVVTPGTEIVCRNKNSPCRGFTFELRRNEGLNFLVMEGTEKKIVLTRPEHCSVSCSMNGGHGRAHIWITDTPYFAVTNKDGRFAIRDVPKGEYNVEVWHAGVGRIPESSGPIATSINGKDEASLLYRIRASKDDEQNR